MNEIESITDFENMNWSVQADPKNVPQPGPVTNADVVSALETTKAASHVSNISKYQKWMDEFGSV